MVSIHRPLGYEPSALPLSYSAIHHFQVKFSLYDLGLVRPKFWKNFWKIDSGVGFDPQTSKLGALRSTDWATAVLANFDGSEVWTKSKIDEMREMKHLGKKGQRGGVEPPTLRSGDLYSSNWVTVVLVALDSTTIWTD